ncbi:hypothetical protein GXP76_35175, partial [Streptomyces sp. NP-1717]|nr:hypothetical protein [Streptomyces sp. NP-1717]
PPAPDPDPEPPAPPEPSGPPEPPSASPMADVRASALSPGDGAGMRKQPVTSPQLGPV